MSERWLRILAAIVAFAVVVFIGIVAGGKFTAESTNSWALITAIALAAAFVAYAGIEYLQTGRFESIARQFDTRTIVLMPLAIAINIILGQTVAAALKIPIYLDSIGTILVGVLAIQVGPPPGHAPSPSWRRSSGCWLGSSAGSASCGPDQTARWGS